MNITSELDCQWKVEQIQLQQQQEEQEQQQRQQQRQQQQQQQQHEQKQKESHSSGGGERMKTMISFVLSDPAKYNELARKGHGRYAWTVYNSILYAVVLVLFGMTFSLSEALKGEWMNYEAATVFTAYMHGVSIIFLIYVEIDAFLTNWRKRKDKKQASLTSSNNSTIESNLSVVSEQVSDVSYSQQFGVEPDHHYVTNLDGKPLDENEADFRHPLERSDTSSMHTEGTTLYLRAGFLVFAVGHLTLVTIQLLVYSKMEMAGCAYTPSMSAAYWHLAFMLTQTLFVMKNAKLVVTRRRWLVRYGLMHVLANNIIVWVRTLTEEIVAEYAHASASNSITSDDAVVTVQGSERSLVRRLLASTESEDTSDPCHPVLLTQIQPYLFPFILEYSLTAVAVFATMYQSLTLRISTALYVSMQQCFARVAKKKSKLGERHEKGSVLAQTILGIISGIAITVVAMAAIGVYFFQTVVREDRLQASLVVGSVNLVIIISMILAIALAIYRLWGFRFTTTRNTSIDSTLLVISLGGMIFMGVFEIIRTTSALAGDEGELSAEEYRLSVTLNATVVIELFQAVAQTCFILDGLRRYAHKREHFVNKPGRNSITFLIGVNVALWLFKSLLMKDILLERTSQMFGVIAGPLIINVNLPLALFFRFHSSVCLAEMWSSAYEPVFELA